jgi:hypothetical protein
VRRWTIVRMIVAGGGGLRNELKNLFIPISRFFYFFSKNQF